MLEYLIYLYGAYVTIIVMLSFFQIKYINHKLRQPSILLDDLKYKKAGMYSIAKEKLNIIDSIIGFVVFLFWVNIGFSTIELYLIDFDNITKTILFVMIFMSINFIISLPSSIYKSFVMDKKYEFSKNLTKKIFILDTIKGAILFALITPVLIGIIAYFIETTSLWWLYSFIALFVFIILVNIFYPIIRAKMFDKFSLLPEGELNDAIISLLEKVDFKSSGIFVVDASKRDSRLNAYFGGLGKTKRVVLFDTLIEKLSKDELIAVLGHELGHFKHKDIIKNIFLMGAILFATFFIISHIPQVLASDMGMSYGANFIIMMFLFLSSIIFFVISPIINLLSRHNEYEADKFGSSLSSSENLANALIKLVNENLSFPYSHPFYVFFYYSHPPLIERLKALGKDM
jgi:STE24 endopeptidase